MATNVRRCRIIRIDRWRYWRHEYVVWWSRCVWWNDEGNACCAGRQDASSSYRRDRERRFRGNCNEGSIMANSYTLNGTTADLAPYSVRWRDFISGTDHDGRSIVGGFQEIDLAFEAAS